MVTIWQNTNKNKWESSRSTQLNSVDPWQNCASLLGGTVVYIMSEEGAPLCQILKTFALSVLGLKANPAELMWNLTE